MKSTGIVVISACAAVGYWKLHEALAYLHEIGDALRHLRRRLPPSEDDVDEEVEDV